MMLCVQGGVSTGEGPSRYDAGSLMKVTAAAIYMAWTGEQLGGSVLVFNDKERNTSINPDEAVNYSAAVQGASHW